MTQVSKMYRNAQAMAVMVLCTAACLALPVTLAAMGVHYA